MRRFAHRATVRYGMNPQRRHWGSKWRWQRRRLVSSGSFGVQVLLGNGRASFSALPPCQPACQWPVPLKSTLADFDHDGNLDLFVVATYPSSAGPASSTAAHPGQLRPIRTGHRPVAIPPRPDPSRRQHPAETAGWTRSRRLELSVYFNNKLGFTSPSTSPFPLAPLSTLSIIGARDP